MYFISDCGKHHAIAHATITYDTNFTTVNNTANVQCQSGYLPDGVQVIKCQENGTWSSSQSCSVKGQFNISGPSKCITLTQTLMALLMTNNSEIIYNLQKLYRFLTPGPCFLSTYNFVSV